MIDICKKHVGPWYHQSTFTSSGLREVTNNMVNRLDQIKHVYPRLHSVAGQGHSGSILVGAISVVSDYEPIICRKKNELSHSLNRVSGLLGEFDYVIVDDLVDSGYTVNNIITQINAEAIYPNLIVPRCIGVLVHNFKKKNIRMRFEQDKFGEIFIYDSLKSVDFDDLLKVSKNHISP